MISEVISKKELQDEQKLMNAIHQNYRNVRMKRKIDEQLKAIAEQEEERYYNRWYKRIIITLVGGLIVLLIGFAIGL